MQIENSQTTQERRPIWELSFQALVKVGEEMI